MTHSIIIKSKTFFAFYAIVDAFYFSIYAPLNQIYTFLLVFDQTAFGIVRIVIIGVDVACIGESPHVINIVSIISICNRIIDTIQTVADFLSITECMVIVNQLINTYSVFI